jgi:hypothetical protein
MNTSYDNTILHNHSWLGDDGLDLSELIVASFMILILWYLFLTWCEVLAPLYGSWSPSFMILILWYTQPLVQS